MNHTYRLALILAFALALLALAWAVVDRAWLASTGVMP